MEPKQLSPDFMPPQPPSSPEFTPEYGATPEAPAPFGERGPEQRQEAAPPAGPQPIPITLPTPVPQQSNAPTDGVVADDLPAVAGDDDLIEKEWVDKAKKIIAETKDDPRKRELEVNRLQVDYLKKRYGKELGTPTT